MRKVPTHRRKLLPVIIEDLTRETSFGTTLTLTISMEEEKKECLKLLEEVLDLFEKFFNCLIETS